MQFQTVTTHSRVSLLTVHMHADYSLVLRLSLVGTPLKVTLNKMTQYYICKFKGGCIKTTIFIHSAHSGAHRGIVVSHWVRLPVSERAHWLGIHKASLIAHCSHTS